jgi:hypothetical protein
MKRVTPNIGLINAFIRLTCGFTLLAWGTSKLVKRPYSSTPLFVVMMAAMKVAEGFTRFCPLTYLFEERMEEMTKDNDDEKKSYDELVNPS